MGGRFRSVMPSDLANVGAIARESLPAPSVEYATEANRVELRRLFTRCDYDQGVHRCSIVGMASWELWPAFVVPKFECRTCPLRRSCGRDGCHHCGTRRGAVIGDHMPPNKQVQQYVHTARRSLLNLPFVKQVRGAWQAVLHILTYMIPVACFPPAIACLRLACLPPTLQLASAMNIPTAPPRQRFYPQCTSCSQKQSAAIRNNKVHYRGPRARTCARCRAGAQPDMS